MADFDSNDANTEAVVASNSAEGPALWADTTKSRPVVPIRHGNSCGLWGETDAGRAIVGAVP